MRKLMLPLAAVCAFGVSTAPSMAASANVKQNKKIGKINGALKGVEKAVSILEDINAGQTDSVNKAHAKVDSLASKVDAIVAVATDALTKLQVAVTSLAGTTAGAAGTDNPMATNAATTATSSLAAVKTADLPTGATYRQFVLLADSATFPSPFNASQATLVAALTTAGLGTLPMGVRTWVKMPDVNSSSLGGDFYKNTWVCMNGKTTTQARALLVSSLSASVGGASNAGAIADVVGTCP